MTEDKSKVKRFLHQHWEFAHQPIPIPRWTLHAKYLLFIIIAASAAINGFATIDLSAPSGYTPIWSACIAIASIFAFCGSMSKRKAWEATEKWAALWIGGLLLVVVVFQIIEGRETGALFPLMVAMLPLGRSLYLFGQAGWRPFPNRPGRRVAK